MGRAPPVLGPSFCFPLGPLTWWMVAPNYVEEGAESRGWEGLALGHRVEGTM